MASYLVETYVPGMQAQDVRVAGRRARAAARKLSREGVGPLHPDDAPPRRRDLLPRLRGPSHEAVAEACRLAGIEAPRIVPAVE